MSWLMRAPLIHVPYEKCHRCAPLLYLTFSSILRIPKQYIISLLYRGSYCQHRYRQSQKKEKRKRDAASVIVCFMNASNNKRSHNMQNKTFHTLSLHSSHTSCYWTPLCNSGGKYKHDHNKNIVQNNTHVTFCRATRHYIEYILLTSHCLPCSFRANSWSANSTSIPIQTIHQNEHTLINTKATKRPNSLRNAEL